MTAEFPSTLFKFGIIILYAQIVLRWRFRVLSRDVLLDEIFGLNFFPRGGLNIGDHPWKAINYLRDYSCDKEHRRYLLAPCGRHSCFLQSFYITLCFKACNYCNKYLEKLLFKKCTRVAACIIFHNVTGQTGRSSRIHYYCL